METITRQKYVIKVWAYTIGGVIGTCLIFLLGTKVGFTSFNNLLLGALVLFSWLTGIGIGLAYGQAYEVTGKIKREKGQ